MRSSLVQILITCILLRDRMLFSPYKKRRGLRMSDLGTPALLVLTGLLAVACSNEQVGCDPVGDLEFVGGPVNAEDLVGSKRRRAGRL
jgi:hypothetical protein